MKRFTLIAAGMALLLGSFGANARPKLLPVEKPDLEAIEDSVLNPAGRFYFPRLQERFEANDTIMTPLEYRYFYLGYMFQEDYDPYRISQFNDSTEALVNRPGEITKHDAEQIFSFSEKALWDNPLDLRQMSFLIHFLRQKGKPIRAKFWEYRLQNLLNAILSTGTGLDMDNAWYVVYPMHEYDLLQFLGYDPTDAEYPADGFDRLRVKPLKDARRFNGDTPGAFYFNVKIPQEEYMLKHPGEE